MKRAHRTWWERLGYLAIYQCPECQQQEFVPRFTYRLGNECRCPRCGTTRLVKLKERDRIDRMESGIWNLLARLGGGKLYHCCFCRMQFYDRRAVLPTQKSSSTPAPENLARAK